MAVLHMDTDEVRQFALYLKRAGDDIANMSSRLQRSANRLDARWSGGDSRRFNSDMRHALRAADRLADDANYLGRRVFAEVDEWEEVDRNGGDAFRGITASDGFYRVGVLSDAGFSPEIMREAFGAGGDFWQKWEMLLFGAAFAHLGFISHGTYSGQIILRGGHLSKELMGLSPNLTHARYSTFAKHIGSNAGKLGLLHLIAPTLRTAEQWMVDIGEHSGDTVRTGTAMTLDALAIFGTHLAAAKVGAVAGAKGGAVVGTFIGGPVGTAVGAVVGGVAGSVAAVFLSDLALDSYLQSDLRTSIVDSAADLQRKQLDFYHTQAHRIADVGRTELAPAMAR